MSMKYPRNDFEKRLVECGGCISIPSSQFFGVTSVLRCWFSDLYQDINPVFHAFGKSWNCKLEIFKDSNSSKMMCNLESPGKFFFWGGAGWLYVS